MIIIYRYEAMIIVPSLSSHCIIILLTVPYYNYHAIIIMLSLSWSCYHYHVIIIMLSYYNYHDIMIMLSLSCYHIIIIMLSLSCYHIIIIMLSLACYNYHVINIGCLGSLAVACWTTDHYHPCSNLGVGLSIITFGGRSAHLTYLVNKSGRKTSIIIVIDIML